MGITLTIKRLFVVTEDAGKHFFTDFSPSVNIVHGKNTSGKSTLFLSILYSFGINDGNKFLQEIISEKLIFRLDFTTAEAGNTEDCTVIRDSDTIYIRKGNGIINKYHGVNSDNSAEHVKLKQAICELFGFSLQLESKAELKQAPIETMFLPFYISQSVGWVYLRKSFSNLDFYKNFKEDYLDYYLGIEPSTERIKKHKIQAELKTIDEKILVLSKLDMKNEDIQLAKLADEEFAAESQSYINKYADKYSKLTERENESVLKKNELAFLEERKAVLQKVSRNHKNQSPGENNCPACSQALPFAISDFYLYQQEANDTQSELNIISAKIKDIQSQINSLGKHIVEDRTTIEFDYSILKKYSNSNVSYDSWINNKANIELSKKLNSSLGELTIERAKLDDELKGFKTDEEQNKLRAAKSVVFETIFASYLKELNVKELTEDRYTKLYQVSAFPYQGVELHQTVLAYHFAFNKLIEETDNIQRFPFMLDAIFKEDLEEDNRGEILKFINKHAPKDTQTIFSVAQSKTQTNNAANYNKDYFEGKAKLIQIGDGTKTRTFLTPFDDNLASLLDETRQLMEGELDW